MAIRHPRSLGYALVALSLSLAACSDSITTPSASNSSSSSLRASGPHMILATTTVTTAVLNPTIDNLYVSAEGHRVFLPANSICQVGVSGYGSAYWNQSCTPQTLPIVFTITTSTDANGYSKMTVSPDVRFSPSKTVTAFIHDTVAVRQPNAFIAYCTLLKGCINEGTTDASMATYRDVTTGYLYRRIKHFSGYNIIFGSGCDPNVEQCDGGAGSRARRMPVDLFSGYITTVGLSEQGQDEDH
jgi:hypothetical protein